jgi:hypothetical protein
MPFFESAVRRPEEYYRGAFYSMAFVRDQSWNGSEPDYAYVNLGQDAFLELGSILGINGHGDGRSFVAFDCDRDGDEDIVVLNHSGEASLFMNQWANKTPNHWLKVSCIYEEGRRALGAVVRVHTGDRIQAKACSVESGYAASYSGPLHFGMGKAQSADLVEVTWPGGKRSRVHSVRCNQAITLRYSE